MPLLLQPVSKADALALVRTRAAAYVGPTNALIHTHLPVSESSVRGVAGDRAREVGKPNMWHWKVVDTELPPSEDDPSENNGRTIAISVWSAHNVTLDRDAKHVIKEEKGEQGSNEPTTNPAETDTGKNDKEKEEKPFLPPELKVDVLMGLLTPLREAQKEIMGSKPYLMLNSLACHPDHHKRGAGTMMLKWGLERADELGLEMYLDTSQLARPMYEKWGFELQRGIDFDRTLWGGEGMDWHGCMLRKPRKQSVEQ